MATPATREQLAVAVRRALACKQRDHGTDLRTGSSPPGPRCWLSGLTKALDL